MAGVHTLLSPSAAKRWMRCAASVAASKNEPKKRDSKDAALGTAKHAVSEFCLAHGLPDAESFLGKTVSADGFDFKVDHEFIEHVNTYLAVVRRHTGKQFYEILLDTSKVLKIADQGGTADCIDLNVEETVLTVIDAKFGYNVIEAQDNEQGLIYLCAARERYKHVAEWKAFRFVISQPRVSAEPDVAEYTAADLDAFEKRAAAAAQEVVRFYAYEPHMIVDMMRPSPEACEWCPIRQTCVARTQSIVEMFTPIESVPKAPTIDNEQLALYLDRVEDIAQWCKDIQQEAYQRAMGGQTVPGYSLDTGRRGNRYWLDPAKVGPALVAAGLAPDDLYEPAPLKSPTDIEKLFKQRKLDLDPLKSEKAGALVGQNEGKPCLIKGTAKKPFIPVKAEFEPSMTSLV